MTNETAVLAAASEITDTYYGYEQGSTCINVQGQGGIPGGGPGWWFFDVWFSRCPCRLTFFLIM